MTPADNLNKQYAASDIESKWYAHWLDKGYFRSTPDEREPFTIVIPPPNVTGVLHMGHMLNNTIQDILIRKARLEGKNACWVPGTDHASIATEAKVVGMLRERGIKKSDLSREEFLSYAFEWKDKYGGIILSQLRKLGASCDWDRTRFTMEPALSRAVVKVFVDLHKKGKIYRGLRITNWDVEAKTVLSNEEVIYRDEQSKLYHVKYFVEGSDEFIVIATQRPETIMADTGLAVNPSDQRYLHLHGKKVLVPLVERAVPIIADNYVDPAFGTGALKVTPAHDPNDYELGQKYGLDVIDSINDDGTLNEKAVFFVGMDRFAARKAIVKELESRGLLVKTEDYTTRIGRSERTNAVVEPKLTLQWFLDMKELASTALHAVKDGDVRFFPEHFYNMYQNWLNEDNIKDWCISRQLWWGQQIPAWYYGEHAFVAETEAEALEQARQTTGNPNLSLQDLKREDDVVDTWFSSWLWPLSVFDAFDGDSTEAKYYYPTNVLVTGWDIMFFWVARMIMAGYEWAPALLGEQHDKMPFKDVYYTGMVRDKMRRKMSKQLGNSPDALALIERYGADGVRFGMLASSPAGNDIVFDAPFDPETGKVLNESELCEQGRNFCNKMWNALRLIKGWEVDHQAQPTEAALYAEAWFGQLFNKTLVDIEENFKSYRLSENIMTIYRLIWGDFCAWYLEMIKPEYGKPIDAQTLETSIAFFERLMTLLHPFMPFVTEEIWSNLRERQAGEDCVISAWPKASDFDAAFLYDASVAQDIVAKIRDTRNQNQLKPKELLKLYITPNNVESERLFQQAGLKAVIQKLASLESIENAQGDESGASFIAGAGQYTLGFEREIDVEEERARLTKELEYARGFLKSVDGKLNNERFVAGAPADVLDRERKKQADTVAKIKALEESLAKL
jgi:valyl-tRNA synthetase